MFFTSIFGPLNINYCIYFNILSIFGIIFGIGLSIILVVYPSLLKGNHVLYYLVILYMVYFQNRLLYDMCYRKNTVTETFFTFNDIFKNIYNLEDANKNILNDIKQLNNEGVNPKDTSALLEILQKVINDNPNNANLGNQILKLVYDIKSQNSNVGSNISSILQSMTLFAQSLLTNQPSDTSLISSNGPFTPIKPQEICNNPKPRNCPKCGEVPFCTSTGWICPTMWTPSNNLPPANNRCIP